MARPTKDHESSRRAGSSVRQALHAEFRAHLNAHRRRYGAFLTVWLAFVAGFGALMVLLDVPQFMAGLFAGVLLGVLLLFAHVLYVGLGLGHRSMAQRPSSGRRPNSASSIIAGRCSTTCHLPGATSTM